MTEQDIQLHVCKWLKIKHKDVLFKSDLSGEFTNFARANKNKLMRSNSGFPDMEILHNNGIHNALFIEFKKATPYKKNGEFKKSEHLQQQVKVHQLLRRQGFKVIICWTTNMAIDAINEYMNINGWL